jgi:benzoate-CoA ligase
VSGAAPGGSTPFDALLEHAPLARPTDTLADDLAFWLWSSGSTGRPKGTVHTHANLYWTSALYGTPILGLRESDVCFSAAKLFFAYGLGNALTFPLAVGATVVLMAERPTPAAVFKRWTTHGVTSHRLCGHARLAGPAAARGGAAAPVLVGRRGAAARDR